MLGPSAERAFLILSASHPPGIESRGRPHIERLIAYHRAKRILIYRKNTMSQRHDTSPHTKLIIKLLAVGLFLVAPSSAAAQPGDNLDREVAAIFSAKCLMCHDDRPGDSGGDVERLLDFVWLSDPSNGLIDDSQTASYLSELIESDNMPKQTWKDDIEWAGPLTTAEKSAVLRWIVRGGPSDVYRQEAAELENAQAREKISERRIVEAIADDLRTLSGTQLRNARYLTLTNLHNQQSVASERLELYRQGLVKMLNSLSRSPDILGMPDSLAPNRVVAIDDNSTIYRFELNHIGWKKDDWERVVEHYPYGLLQADGLGDSVYKLTDSAFPYMRADWFVFATSQAPLYHDLVGIDAQLKDLERKLGVDRLGNIKRFQVARAGFGNSLVSVNNRLIERHTIPGGYFHISYDFFKNNGKANFFDFPLGPAGASDDDFSFEHDGGEVIYSLPNGFQAYALVKSTGERISIAPAAIVHDDSMSQIGSVILNGISCISCHYDGMKPENPARLATLDEVRERALQNFQRFDSDARKIIEQLYPPHEKFAELVDADRRAWRNALAQADLNLNGSTEPVRALFDSFVRNLDLEVAAADFGLTEEAFSAILQRESESRQLAFRFNKSGLQRQLYVEEFQRMAEILGLGVPRPFELLELPWFGHNPDLLGDSIASTPVESELLTANNQPTNFEVVVRNSSAQKAFVDGEAIPVSIRTSEPCFLTLISIDPNGAVTSLIPNKLQRQTDGELWWSPLKLEANHTLEISVSSVGFEFFAQAPHGATKIRAIATKQPLKLQLGQKIAAELAEGIPVLGQTKGAGVRFGQQQSPEIPNATAVPLGLLPQSLDKLFAPNEWATSEWTFLTRQSDDNQ